MTDALQAFRDAFSDLEHAFMLFEMELDETSGASVEEVYSDREIEIERLRRENLALRDTIRKLAEAARRRDQTRVRQLPQGHHLPLHEGPFRG